jgi:hypothetical protein
MLPDNIATAKYKLKNPSLRQKESIAGFVPNTTDVEPMIRCATFHVSFGRRKKTIT